MTNRTNVPSDQSSQGTIISASRRHAHVIDDQGKVLKGTIASKAMHLSIGDRVTFSWQDDQPFVESVLPRKNCLARVYRKQTREICANLDRLGIVAAPRPTFNTTVIDRISVAARMQQIPISLIVNKIDLDLEPIKQIVGIYEGLGFEIIWISAKFGQGMEMLTSRLADPALQIVAFCGISGVGKSTIINRLLPEIATRTGELSARTGHGRQTTTQSVAYPYRREGEKDLLIVDLPGLQSFGVSHLEPLEVAASFDEIAARQHLCEFSNCLHVREDKCAVREAVERGEIAPFRFQSYCDILLEIEDSREY